MTLQNPPQDGITFPDLLYSQPFLLCEGSGNLVGGTSHPSEHLRGRAAQGQQPTPKHKQQAVLLILHFNTNQNSSRQSWEAQGEAHHLLQNFAIFNKISFAIFPPPSARRLHFHQPCWEPCGQEGCQGLEIWCPWSGKERSCSVKSRARNRRIYQPEGGTAALPPAVTDAGSKGFFFIIWGVIWEGHKWLSNIPTTWVGCIEELGAVLQGDFPSYAYLLLPTKE